MIGQTNSAENTSKKKWTTKYKSLDITLERYGNNLGLYLGSYDSTIQNATVLVHNVAVPREYQFKKTYITSPNGVILGIFADATKIQLVFYGTGSNAPFWGWTAVVPENA